jgi:hypothetical protein
MLSKDQAFLKVNKQPQILKARARHLRKILRQARVFLQVHLQLDQMFQISQVFLHQTQQHHNLPKSLTPAPQPREHHRSPQPSTSSPLRKVLVPSSSPIPAPTTAHATHPRTTSIRPSPASNDTRNVPSAAPPATKQRDKTTPTPPTHRSHPPDTLCLVPIRTPKSPHKHMSTPATPPLAR